ncbi:MAG: CheR family methyltransferase [Bacteroidia bacterium]
MSSEGNEISLRVEISDAELDSLTSAIKGRYGIDFTCYEKKSLKRGFARLIARNELESLVGLWAKILKDKEFLIKYIDDLLVNLTELFRNTEIWHRIKSDLLVKLNSKSVINIWHAGCSTGEELYSMAIVLKEANMLAKTQALATDLSTTALESAKQGAYSKMLWNKYINSYKSFNSLGNPEKYFIKN